MRVVFIAPSADDAEGVVGAGIEVGSVPAIGEVVIFNTQMWIVARVVHDIDGDSIEVHLDSFLPSRHPAQF